MTGGTFSAGTTYTVYTGISNTASYKDAVSGDSERAYAYILYDNRGYAMAVVGLNGVLDTSNTLRLHRGVRRLRRYHQLCLRRRELLHLQGSGER